MEIRSSSMSYTPPPSSVSATRPATPPTGELASQIRDQREALNSNAKNMAETVYISQQAQQMLNTYTSSYQAATGQDASTSGGSATGSISASDMMDATQKLQTRQTRMAVAEYAQQQAQATPPASQTPAPQPLEATPAGSQADSAGSESRRISLTA